MFLLLLLSHLPKTISFTYNSHLGKWYKLCDVKCITPSSINTTGKWQRPPLEMSLSPGRMVVEHSSWEETQQEPRKRSPGQVKKEMGSCISERLRYMYCHHDWSWKNHILSRAVNAAMSWRGFVTISFTHPHLSKPYLPISLVPLMT